MDQSRRRDAVSELYDRWAHTYDADENRTRDLCGVAIRSDLASLAGGDVVELGCGTGINTAWFAETARSVVAIDFSTAMLEQAQARVAKTRHVRFVNQDIRAPVSLPRESADLVVIALVLEHVEHIAAVIADCRRLLRQGGYLYICELHPFRQWMGAQAEFVDKSGGDTVSIPAYQHPLSEYVNAILASDLRLVGISERRDGRDQQRNAPPRVLTILSRAG